MRIGGADSQFDNFISGTSATANACGNTTYTIYEDYSITVTAPLACPYPITNLLISELYTTSAVINFEEATGEAGLFEAEYSTKSDFPAGETTFINHDDEDAFDLLGPSVTLENLEPATKYYIRVRAYCEDELSSGEWSSVFSFSTECIAVSAFPWSENFDTREIGDIDFSCWKNEHISGSGSYVFQVSNGTGDNNSKVGKLPDMSSGTITDLSLPKMEIPSADAYEFSINVYRNASGSSYPTEGLRIWAVQGEDSTDLGFISRNFTQSFSKDGNLVVPAELASGWYTYTFTIPYKGDLNIIVRGESKFGSATYFDDLRVRLAPTCSKLAAIADPTDITASSATFAWTAGGSETNFEYVIAEKDSTPDWSSPVAVDGASSVTVSSGLQPNTAYDFYVRANCGDGDINKGDALHVSFTTKCLAVSEFPWFEHFDSITAGSGILPDCWSKINTASSSSYSSYPYVFTNGSYSTYAHSASNGLYFYTYYSTTSSYSGEDEYAILPQMSSLEGKRISFYAKGYNATGIIKVGTMSDPSDASTFAEIQSITLTTSYEKYTVDLSGSNHYIALKVTKPTTTYAYNGAYVDDITVEDIPSCLEPTGLAFVEATANSAKFNLTAGGTETAWDFYYSTENVAPTAETVPQVVAAADTAISSGLNPNTLYYVWVRAHCSDTDQSPWSEGISFRSGCAPYEAASFSDDFEDGIYCWTVGNLQSEDGVSHVPYPYWKAAYNGENGLYMIAYKSSGTVHDSAYAVLPQMNYGEKSLKDFSISFYAKAPNLSDNTHLILGVVADPADSLASFEQITQFDLTTSFDIYEYSFASYEGSKPYIVLLATLPEGHASSTSKTGEFYIDDIALFETPSCQPLRSISISDLARRSMVVNLEPKAGIALASEYELVISKTELDEAALEAADKISINDTNAYEINGLDRETLYYIYVRANCGGENGKSAWVSTSAKTKALSACDDVQVGNGSYNGYYAPIAAYYKNSWVQFIYPASEIQQAGMIGAISFYCSATDASTDLAGEVNIYMAHTSKSDHSSTSDWLAAEDLTLVYHTDAFEKPAATGWMSFDLNTAFAYNGTDNIAIVVAAKLPNYSTNIKFDYWPTDNALLYRGNDDNTAYGEHPGNNSGTRSTNRPNIKFTFCHELPACPAVSELTAAVLGTGTTQEKISWAISGADYLSGFDMIVSKTELDDEALAAAEITHANIQGLSKDLEGLTPSTDYYVYLRAICQAEEHDEGNSDWASVHFKTLADCPAVINLSLELGATDSITATWERATMEQAKAFKYILSTERLDKENITAELNDVNDTVIAFSGLNHAQKYYFYVASACGDATSAFVEDSIETLPACQAVENLAASRVEHNRVELAWTSAQLATETEWKVGIVGDPIPAQTVSERNALLFGLSAETAYEAYVIALCGEESVSDSAKVAFNTAAQPGSCKQVGSETGSTYAYPINNFYKYSYSQQIFDASELSTGLINSISFQYAYSTAMTKATDVTIYMGITDKATFSGTSDWVALSDLTQVYQGALNCSQGWNEFTLQTPFNYDGSGNLVLAVHDNTEAYDGSSYKFNYTSCTGNKTLYYQSDNNECPANAPLSGTLAQYRNNIQFCFEPKAAPDVTALAISDITTESAKASWEPMGSETAWNVFISPTQVTDFSGVVAERVETLSKSFTGLNDDEDYFVYVQPAVEGAEYSMVSFRTVASCLIQTNPAVVAESVTAHTARVTWVDPNEVKAGNYKVVYAKAAEFDLENADLAYVNTTDTFADLSGLQADTVYKFAVMANCGGDDESRYSIAAQFTTPQSCFTPNAPDVVAASITAHEATVFWKDDHDDAGYLVAYGLYDSFDLDNPETYLTKYVTDTIAVLEGLTAGESYKVSIKGDCSSVGEGQSKTWAPYAYFNTKCEAKALPYSEDFETNSALVCWTVGNVQEERDSYSSYLSYDPGRASSAKANGEYGLKIHAYKSTGYYGTDADSAYAVLPELVFGEDAITDYQIRFNAKANIGSGYYSNYYSHLLIGLAEDDALTNLAIIADTAISTSAFQEVELSFAAYAGTGNRIVLLARVDPSSTASTREAEIYVDDIYVSKISACKRPASIEVSAITESSASFAWTAGGEETNFEYIIVAAGETPDWSLATAVNGASSVEVTEGLVASTAYDFYVRTNCGEGEENKSDARSITFRTICGAVVVDTENAFEEGFEDSDFAPACWENIASGTYAWTKATTQHHSGNASAYSGYYGDIYLVLPPLAIADAGERVEISFWSYNTFVSDYDKNSVVLLGETEQELWSPESVSQSWKKDSIDLSAFKGQTITLAFKYKGSNAHGWYIDDVKVEFVSEGGIGTGIDAIGTESEKAVKFVKDDHIYILRNGILYDVTGRLIRK